MLEPNEAIISPKNSDTRQDIESLQIGFLQLYLYHVGQNRERTAVGIQLGARRIDIYHAYLEAYRIWMLVVEHLSYILRNPR